MAIRTSGVTGRATEGLPDAADETTRRDYRSINAAVRYEMFSVFQVKPSALGEKRSAAIIEARTFFDTLADAGVTLRGLYQVAGLRADALSSGSLACGAKITNAA